jgi:2-enoate reductase
MPQLGGNLNAASVPSFKKDMRLYRDYLIREIERNCVEVVVSKEATPDLVSGQDADVVIIATGSSYTTLEIPGALRESVISASDALMNHRLCGATAIVIGGGTVGCEVAVYLAQKGRKVAVVEMLDNLADGMFEANAQQLVKMVLDSGIQVFTESEVKGVTDEGVIIVDKEGSESSIKADTIVNACGFKPNNHLYESLKSESPEVYAVGDCVKPRQVMAAVWEAYRLARLI